MPQIYAGRMRLSRPTNQRNFNGQVLTNGFDSLLRRTAMGLQGQSSTLVKYGYDKASRMENVTNGVNVATYAYVANSPLVSQITFKNSGTTRMTTTKSYDKLNRLTSIGSVAASTVGSTYDYNSANQRKRNTQADGSCWAYEYDSLGQVISGKKYWNDGTPVEGQQFEYAFDDIGNRRSSKSGGDAAGANLRSATYSANALNQYTSRTVPGHVDVVGAADARATVTVNSGSTYRKGEYFRKELAVANSATNVLQSVDVAATWGSTNDPQSGKIFVAQTPEAFYYDADGNLTNDGRWFYTWDAENRLVQMIATNVVDGARKKLTFEYDFKGRRSRKTSYHPNGAGWVVTNDHRFVYDGWNLVAELNATNNAVIRSYVWGIDFSGTSQGAGGVGGLLAVNDAVNGVHFAAYDGNGNLNALTKASDGTTSATYEYGPFGETIRSTGPMAKGNPFRFSTKYTDDESDLVYYGFRYFYPNAGRWLVRDPLYERGGFNLYVLVGNDPASQYDYLGAVGSGNGLYLPGISFGFPLVKFPKEITPTYDFDEPSFIDRLAQPGDTVYLDNLAEVVRDLQRKTARGCCVKKLTLTSHGGSPGVLPIGSGISLSEDTLDRQQRVLSNPSSSQANKDLVNEQDNSLLALKPYLCNQATIDFVTCKSGAGRGGQRIREHLRRLFGGNVTILLHEYDCRWSYGEYHEVK